jgi:HK97 gp10 family phage protein
MDIEVENVDVVIAQLGQSFEDFEQGVDEAIQRAGQTGQEMAQDIVPVRTGYLQGSITYNAPGVLISEYFTDVYYSIFVEEGTQKMQERPYMIPAFEEAKEQLLSDIQAL